MNTPDQTGDGRSGRVPDGESNIRGIVTTCLAAVAITLAAEFPAAGAEVRPAAKGPGAARSGGAAAVSADGYLHFRTLTLRDGLPAAAVQRIFEDSRGFIWFATMDGLVRYDSREMRVFRPDPKDPHSIVDGRVLDFAEDGQGNLWLATLSGLDLWQRATERFVHFRQDPAHPVSLSHTGVRCLLPDSDGALWVGTDGGLNHFNPRTGQWKYFFPEPGRNDSISDLLIRCLFRDRKGVLWIGTSDGGLNRFDAPTGRFRVYAHDPNDPRSLSHQRVSSIAEGADGSLWLGTDDGVCRLDPERRFFERFPINVEDPGALQVRIVDAVMVDRLGRVWVGTDGGGVSRFDPATRRFIHHRHSKLSDNTLASDSVRTLFEDRRGDLWVGHFPAGVSHANRLAAPFQVFRAQAGETNTLSDDQILSFWEDPSGDLWVGTDNGGLNHWNPATGRWRAFRHDPRDPRSLGAKAALTVWRDQRGQLWVGTWNGGLNRFEPDTGTFQRYLPDAKRTNALSSPHVWRLLEDRQNQLWAATTGGGVERYVPEEDGFVHHRSSGTNECSLNNDYVWSLLVTRDGTLWAGNSAGLARRPSATGIWERWPDPPESSGTRFGVMDLLEDHEGMVWASTEGGGLRRLNPRTGAVDILRVADGLPSEVLRGLLEDDDGILWVASNKGLSRVDPRTRQIRTYDESSGLPSRQFSPSARLRLRSGELLFGTTQGFVKFNPRALESNTNPPPVVLTDLRVFDQTVRPGGPDSPLRESLAETRRLEIPARLSMLTFRFAVLNYRSPQRNRCLYKLEGFDTDWREPGMDLQAIYTNLDPGRYRFHVKAANNDGVWNETGASLELIIVPPWWRTWWFRGAGALALLSGAVTVGWAISTRRTRARLREADQERQLAQERERAAEAVRCSQQELQLILNSIPAMIWYKDTRNNILAVNRTAALLEGLEPDQIHGRSCQELYPAELADAYYRDDLEVIRSGKPKLNSQVAHIATGSKHRSWLEVSRVPVFDKTSGAVTSVIAFAIDITQRKQAELELERAHQQLVETSRKAGMAEIATGVLHNVGNVLNSVNVSASVIVDRIRNSRSASLARLDGLLDQHTDDLADFLTRDAKGRQIPGFVKHLSARLQAERAEVLAEASGLTKNIEHIKGIVAMQQSYARVAGVVETVPVDELVEDALRMNADAFVRHEVQVVREYAPVPPVTVDRHKALQILVNVLRNAKHACDETGRADKRVTVRVGLNGEGTVKIEVADNGVGIAPENRLKIFQHGFTTRKNGHGFGLHSSANTAREMGGSLTVHSEGPGCGACFTLELPLRDPSGPAARRDLPPVPAFTEFSTNEP